MARQITYRCDRCHAELAEGTKPINASLILAAKPVQREKKDLCESCADALAAFNREFLSGAFSTPWRYTPEEIEARDKFVVAKKESAG